MYGSVKWCIASEVAFVDRRTCAWATRHFPQKPYYFHSICPLVRTPAQIGSLRARMRTFIAHEEKFLSANFIEDDRMITALREFLINRGNFFIVTANLRRARPLIFCTKTGKTHGISKRASPFIIFQSRSRLSAYVAVRSKLP